MSCQLVEWPADAVELPLSDSECLLLLDADIDIIDFDLDLLRSLPCNGGKLELGPAALEACGAVQGALHPPSPPEVKPSCTQLVTALDQCKQESFPIWVEEKAPPPPPPRAADTAELLREFETVYGAVELTHLTPPQSPPGPATQLLLSYAQAQHAPWTHIDAEMAIVDELVRHSSAPLPSPSPSPTLHSSSPSCGSSSSADEEWERPRARPHARSTDDRRSRKKEQNKNAATRYRQKKKAEIEVLLSEESALRQRRGELGNKCSDLQREIRYLKGLMRDLFKAKGLIK